MSVYFKKGKGYRYDFTMKGQRYTEAWFKKKKEAREAEARKREELKSPAPNPQDLIATTFLDLVNMRLDFIQEYKTKSYYDDNRYVFRRLAKGWGRMPLPEITPVMIQEYLLGRAKESHYAANYDLRLMKALFNHAVRNKLLPSNPVIGLQFLPVEKRTKYVPSMQDIDKVIAAADPETQDYLWTIRETLARVSEINRLIWDDVDLEHRYVVLYTRKKKGGHLTPRKIPMTEKLFEVLSRRHLSRDQSKPWVFWHTYQSSKTKEKIDGPFQDRKLIMRTLCKKAGVKYFRFHALRHAGASIMAQNNAPIQAIQGVLGHDNQTTTNIYLHNLIGSENLAIAIYEQARKNSHTESHTNEKWAAVHTLQPILN